MTNLLTYLIFLPLLALVIISMLPARSRGRFKQVTLLANIIQLCFAALLFAQFDSELVSSYLDGFQFVERYDWINLSFGGKTSFKVEYHIGVDGLSLPFVLLTPIIMIIATLSSWSEHRNEKGYFVLLNLLNTSIIGSFLALDLFLFYLFFELMLLPMFFLIGIWGGPNRSYASIKFFIYTLLGSVMILAVMIISYLSVIQPGGESHSFNLIHLLNISNYTSDSILVTNTEIVGVPARVFAFGLLFLGFAIKLPIVPFHTWLPDAHVEAPTAISVILAGLLLKVGGYGIFRIAFGMFPDGAIYFSNWIAVIGVLSIVYGGLNALAQRDLKRMIAYSSVSHMGFVMVGLASFTKEGISGAVFHMISHGLISAALFLIAGVIYDRTKDREIDHFSGLASIMPQFTFVTIFVFFASLGLPGLSGFIGELLVFIGAFSSSSGNEFLSPWIGYGAISGIIISATYYLWTLQRMYFGPTWFKTESWNSELFDLNRREWISFGLLMTLILLLGVYPNLLLDVMGNSVNSIQDFFLAGRDYMLTP